MAGDCKWGIRLLKWAIMSRGNVIDVLERDLYGKRLSLSSVIGSGTVDKMKLTEQEERELNDKLIAITQEVHRRTG